MNLYQTYSQGATSGLSRVDTILALYDGAILSMENARATLQEGDLVAAYPYLSKAQMYIVGLAQGLDLSRKDITLDFLRLFVFSANCIASRDAAQLADALGAVKTLREGFRQIRPEALRLEQEGVIPALAPIQLVHRSA